MYRLLASRKEFAALQLQPRDIGNLMYVQSVS